MNNKNKIFYGDLGKLCPARSSIIIGSSECWECPNIVQYDPSEKWVKCRAVNQEHKTMLIKQPGRTGDILICLPIAKYYCDRGFDVFWLCPESYHDIFRNINYATPVDSDDEKRDVTIDLSFGFGGNMDEWWRRNKYRFSSFVEAKYEIAGVPIEERWRLVWERNKHNEYMLWKHHTSKTGYTLVHRVTHTGAYLIDISLASCTPLFFGPIDDYNIFDWYWTIKKAKEIHCIDSALANFIEAVPEFRDIKKAIYLSVRESDPVLRSIYKNNWEIK